jgi:hypothetical protein
MKEDKEESEAGAVQKIVIAHGKGSLFQLKRRATHPY